MISPILAAHDATTVTLDFGVFIAEQAKTYRTSQCAIIAALRPCITPSQPEAPSKPHAPAADTPASQAAGDTTGAEVSSSLASAPVENSVAGNPVTLIPEAPKPLPDDEEMRRPVEAKTSEQEASADASGGMQDESAIHPAAPSPRMTKREQVRACHIEHPDWTSHQIAEHLGFGVQHIQVMASHLSLKLPRAPRTPPENMRDKVLAVVAAHPDWTLRQIAAEAGCSLGTASKWAKEAAEEPPEAGAPSDEPQTQPAPELPPLSKPSERLRPLVENDVSDVLHRPRKAPSGRFYLREHLGRGQFLHMSGTRLTGERQYAWIGTEKQLLAARKAFPAAADMVEEAIRP